MIHRNKVPVLKKDRKKKIIKTKNNTHEEKEKREWIGGKEKVKSYHHSNLHSGEVIGIQLLLPFIT